MKTMQTTLFFFLFLSLTTAINLNADPIPTTTKQENQQQATSRELIIKVKGMVCAFCAQGIERNFAKEEAVESTRVDLDKMLVYLRFKEGKILATEKIEKIITGAGFVFAGVQP